MIAIAAVDKLWGIGRDNGLLFDLKKDMRFFREKTLNKTVVFGANTLASFPQGKALKNRVNILLSASRRPADCIAASNVDELLKIIKDYPPEDVFIIGGGRLYKALLPYCEKAYITMVNADGGATVFFDNLDAAESWRLEDESAPQEDNGYTITFRTYKNLNPLKL